MQVTDGKIIVLLNKDEYPVLTKYLKSGYKVKPLVVRKPLAVTVAE